MPSIAVIGGGISGMTCAYALARRHNVTLFEANATLGGHTDTHSLTRPDGTWAVDTGFIVYNDKTYPQFIRLLKQLSVEGRPTTMSFSVSSPSEDLEYNGTTLNALFAQRRNLVRPSFLRMVRGILRFNKDCKALLLEQESDLTLGSFIDRGSYGSEFCEWYIKPMAAAVWSTGTAGVLDMPIYFLARFFENHGFLNIDDRPQWYTVQGGSQTYVKAITKALDGKIRLNCAVQSVSTERDKVQLRDPDGSTATFDYAVVATHSNTALRLLKQPTALEQSILGAIGWSTNQIILHTDESILPRRKLAHAAWNYHLVNRLDTASAVVTYHMNLLQGLPSQETFLVTLNHSAHIDSAKIIKRLTYEHPIFDAKATAAQRRWQEFSGPGARIKYAGAYWFNGFHEDGVASGLRAAQAIDPECVL